LPANFVHAEWITLHDSLGFRRFVGFLRAESAHAPVRPPHTGEVTPQHRVLADQRAAFCYGAAADSVVVSLRPAG
jgi:hypothetical protein